MMNAYLQKESVYVFRCDVCGKIRTVKKSDTYYNAAQAVRSIHWSYGKDRTIKCDECRKKEHNDRYA